MKTATFTFLFALLLLQTGLPAQSGLQKAYDSVSSVLKQYESDPFRDFDNLISYRNKIKQILQKEVSPLESGLPERYLTALLRNELAGIERQLVAAANLTWYDLENEERFFTNLTANNSELYGLEQQFEGRSAAVFRELRSASQLMQFFENVAGTDGFSEEQFRRLVWPELVERPRRERHASDSLLFCRLTPDSTRMQYESYLQGFTVYNRGGFSDFGYDALHALFLLYNHDGEPQTLENFAGVYLQDPGKGDHWHVFYDRLRQESPYYLQLEKIHRQIGLSQSNDEVGPAANRAFIQLAAPFEVSLLTLHQLIRPDLMRKDYAAALITVREFAAWFAERPFFGATTRKYRELEALLVKLKEEESVREDAEPLRGLSELPFAPIRFFLNADRQLLGVVPHARERGDIFVYRSADEEGLRWSRERTEPHNRFQTYQFSHIKLKKDELRSFVKKDDILNKRPAFNNTFKEDFFIHFFNSDQGVAIFASSADHRRLELNAQGNDYRSPWRINRQLGLQEFAEEGLMVRPFHGKVAGNVNTDLYYCFTEDGGRTWGDPINFGALINTPFSERSPFFDPHSKTLYFSSEGHAGLGGYDVFSVRLKLEKDGYVPAGEVENLAAANSVFDELYYQDLPLREGDARRRRYFSSNRSGSFQVYQLRRGESGRVVQPDIRRKTDVGLLDLGVTMECRKLNGEQFAPDGKIYVFGRVVNRQGEVVPDARVTFIDPDHSATEAATTDEEGGFDLLIRANAKYLVQVQRDLDGRPQYYSIHRTDVCANPDRQHVAYAQIVTSPDFDLQEQLPFFFAFDISRQTINNTYKVERFYRKLIEETVLPREGLRLRISGFADQQGEADYNRSLSYRRARTVADFLHRLGLPYERMIVEGLGETDQYDRDAGRLDHELNPWSLPASIFSLGPEQQKFQLNRRSKVEFVDLEK